MKESEILKELKNLKRKKASGLDNFPPGLLKDAAHVLTKPLTFIINFFIETGVVPSEWKVAKVIPLYKSGSLAEIDNYRPISILPSLSKILEKIVYKQLMAHLERHSLLFEYQFGFRPNRSTELQSSSNFVGKFTKDGPTEVNLCGCYENFDYLRMFTPLFVFPPSPSSMLDSRQ